jgi:hypothetical protein
MALRIARGLFRLWLVLSVLWIGGVGVVTWWTFPWPAVPYVNGQIETGSDGKQYVYDARANEWWPVTETHTVKPSADPEVAPRDTPPPSVDPDKYWAALNAEARRAEIWYASAVALVPPAFVLALGSALFWVFRGFR